MQALNSFDAVGWLPERSRQVVAAPALVGASWFQGSFRQLSDIFVVLLMAGRFMPLRIEAGHCKNLKRERKRREPVHVAGECPER